MPRTSRRAGKGPPDQAGKSKKNDKVRSVWISFVGRGRRVISRTSTAAYRNTGRSIAQIGNELNVDLIVERSVTNEPLRNDERYAKLLR